MEKQFCALVLATPNVEDRIAHKKASIMAFLAARKVALAWLIGLKDVPHFRFAVAFFLGNLVRHCNLD